MQLVWSEDQRSTRETFRDFGASHIAPGAVERDRDARFDPGLWLQLAKKGFWELGMPAAYGGRGGSRWDFLAAFEGLAAGARDHGFVLSVVAHAGLLRVIDDHGTEEQKDRLLRGLLSGEIGATAATEPGGGSHVANVRTTGAWMGGSYRLNGEKAHITNAPVADRALVVGRLPELGKRDITLFLVARSTPGVTFGAAEDLLGQRSSPTGPIFLRDAEVDESDLLGAPGEGLATLYAFLAFDRLLYGVAVAGFLEPIIEQAMGHVQRRVAFGVPLAQHEYVQGKLVDMKMTMECARLLAYSAAAALERGDEAFSAQASLAKLAASEGMVKASVELIQIFGHAGYDRTQPIERCVRDALALRIAGGTTEMQKLNVFKQLGKASAIGERSAARSAHDDPVASAA
jgi:isovaleryl-CoA dehydrogenase